MHSAMSSPLVVILFDVGADDAPERLAVEVAARGAEQGAMEAGAVTECIPVEQLDHAVVHYSDNRLWRQLRRADAVILVASATAQGPPSAMRRLLAVEAWRNSHALVAALCVQTSDANARLALEVMRGWADAQQLAWLGDASVRVSRNNGFHVSGWRRMAQALGATAAAASGS